ncbi:MAG: hypothetical protein HYU57_08440 [Micavibrio aeruginosavorus]|nr:hypothetical protein [Micavibrio aeruginosavorus]
MSTGLNPRKALEEALRHTVPAQDPGFYTERENLLSLLRSLRNDPCNDDLRKNYAGAVKTFEIVIDKDWDRVPREQWKETIDAYGTLMNTSGHFNQPIIQEIQESILEGFLSSDEISKNYRATKNDSRFYNARQKSCSNNTAYISPLEEEYWDNYRRSAYDMFEDFFFGYFYMSDTEEEKQEQEEQEEPDEWEEEQEEKYEPD